MNSAESQGNRDNVGEFHALNSMATLLIFQDSLRPNDTVIDLTINATARSLPSRKYHWDFFPFIFFM